MPVARAIQDSDTLTMAPVNTEAEKFLLPFYLKGQKQ